MDKSEYAYAHINKAFSIVNDLVIKNDLGSSLDGFDKVVDAVGVVTRRTDIDIWNVVVHLEGNEDAVVFLIKSGAV